AVELRLGELLEELAAGKVEHHEPAADAACEGVEAVVVRKDGGEDPPLRVGREREPDLLALFRDGEEIALVVAYGRNGARVRLGRRRGARSKRDSCRDDGRRAARARAAATAAAVGARRGR